MPRPILRSFLSPRIGGFSGMSISSQHALDDDALPDATSWEELKAYLLTRNPKADTDTAKAIWQFYSKKKG